MMTLDPRFADLSCYTSNLAGYLASEFDDAPRRFAEAVRLAVRVDPLGELEFLHHRPGLDRMPDGSRLSYAVAADLPAAISGLRAELAGHGRCLVVMDNTRLPWSPAYRTTASAPHWVLLDCHLDVPDYRWHLTDMFGGLLPLGDQLPHQQWTTTEELVSMMARPPSWRPEQRRRNELVFGYRCMQPDSSGPLWLLRQPDTGIEPPEPSGDWLRTDEEILPFLCDYFSRDAERAARYLDDVWAAAKHRAFRHRVFGHGPAEQAWLQFPSALRFAVDSMRRGRPRWSLLQTTIDHILKTEAALDAVSDSSNR